MNQKEFELIATILREADVRGYVVNYDLLVEDVIIELKRNYPKTFDPNKFLKLLGL